MRSALALSTHRVRRAVGTHRRLLAAGFAAAAVAGGLHTVSPPPADTTDVVVAATDLAAGEPLQHDQLDTVALPDDLVPDGALRSRAAAAGELLAAPMRAGAPLTDLSLVGAPLVDSYGEGRVAAPVRIADAAAVDLLRTGDHVDVLAADPRGAAETAVVAADAPVVVVPQTDSSRAGSSGALVVLAVTPRTAGRLAQAAVVGPLSVAIRG